MTQSNVVEQPPLKTNHNIRIVTLTTAERVLCMFGDIEDGTVPINYGRWCPFSPIEDHRISGEHIISVVYPDNNIVDNYATRLKEVGLTDEQIFWEQTNGDNSKPTETK